MSHTDRNVDDALTAEHDAMDEAEAVNPHQVDEADTEESELLQIERGADADQAMPAEAAAVHTDTEAAAEASGDVASDSDEINSPMPPVEAGRRPARVSKTTAKGSTPAKVQKTRHSQRYQEKIGRVDARRAYSAREALELAKETSLTRFDGAMEVHLRLSRKKGKDSGERFRTIVTLPHGSGKEPRIGVLDDELIAKIKQKGDTDFDILLAPPSLMPKVAQIAKILGPKGKMPNPKTGTVTDDSEAATRAILSGRVELRADAGHNLHQIIGRVSWPAEKLLENYQALLAVMPGARLQRVTVAATMGPGVWVDLNK